MEVKTINGHLVIALCAWKKSTECPDRNVTNEDAKAESARLNIPTISHGVCEFCETIINKEFDEPTTNQS